MVRHNKSLDRSGDCAFRIMTGPAMLDWIRAAANSAVRRHRLLLMTTPRLLADFNGLFGDVLCLSHSDTSLDENGVDVPLRAGMTVIAFEPDPDENGAPDNLIAAGIVEESPQ